MSLDEAIRTLYIEKNDVLNRNMDDANLFDNFNVISLGFTIRKSDMKYNKFEMVRYRKWMCYKKGEQNMYYVNKN